MKKRFSKSVLRAQRRKIKPSDVFEQKLLNYFKKVAKIKIRNNMTLDELSKELSKIDYSQLTKIIRQTSTDIFNRNQNGYKNIINAMIQGSNNVARQQRLDLVMQQMVHEKSIYEPLMYKFAENVSLIKNIPLDCAKKLWEGYDQGVSFRGTDIERYLTEHMGKRAKLIIRTESSKLNSAITEVRSRRLSIPAYFWSTSEDRRVRPSHKMMDNVLVFWSTRLTLDKMNGHAGEYPNCRCTSIPVVELEDIRFPVKVAEGNLTIQSKKNKAEIISGRIKTYTRDEFLKTYGQYFEK